MAKDLYLRSYEYAGLDVIQTSLAILMAGQLSRYGHRNYDEEHLNICLVLAPHLAGLFADFWNIQDIPSHDILNAHEGQLHGFDTAVGIADNMHSNIHPADLEFLIEETNHDQSEAATALYFSDICDKIKEDLCELIKISVHEKREALRKLTPKAPERKREGPKPAGPKPPGYDPDPDSIFH